MASASNLRLKGNLYHFRRKIPPGLRERIGKAEWVRSLGTGNARLAAGRKAAHEGTHGGDSSGLPPRAKRFSLRHPVDVFADIEKIAAASDRPRSWAMVRALRMYLAGEGAEILNIDTGREAIAVGDDHDMNDVLGEIEEIVQAGSSVAGRSKRTSSWNSGES